ncbi:MAG: hemerythrin domain-containing protein, partial [Vulcanimicrobiaceae bacterium]
MDILDLIKKDHNEVKALFKEYASMDLGETIGRQNLATKIMEELVKHDEAEEQTLYATLKERLSEMDDRVQVLEGYEEHAMASDLIKKLKKVPPSDEDFLA